MSGSTWGDMIAHARAEEKLFRQRATAQRKLWLELRRKRDWLGALQAKDREQEYRRSAELRRAFINEHKAKAS